jgi:hypothetical protein
MEYNTQLLSHQHLLSSSNPSSGADVGLVLPGVHHHSPVGAGVIFDEAVDLEPIDFEHFVDEENDGDQGGSIAFPCL